MGVMQRPEKPVLGKIEGVCRWAYRCRLWKNPVSLASSVSVMAGTKDGASEQRPASNDPQNACF